MRNREDIKPRLAGESENSLISTGAKIEFALPIISERKCASPKGIHIFIKNGVSNEFSRSGTVSSAFIKIIFCIGIIS